MLPEWRNWVVPRRIRAPVGHGSPGGSLPSSAKSGAACGETPMQTAMPMPTTIRNRNVACTQDSNIGVLPHHAWDHDRVNRVYTIVIAFGREEMPLCKDLSAGSLRGTVCSVYYRSNGA